MNTYFRSAALIALILVLLPALALATTAIGQTRSPHSHGALIFTIVASLGLLGTVGTVTYNFTPQGTTKIGRAHV